MVSDPMGLTANATLKPDDILFASHLTVRPKSTRTDSVDLILSVLNGALSQVVEGQQPLGLENALSESSDRFHGVHWDTFSQGDRWAGELTWIHPHPVLPGLPCTTHVAIARQRDRTQLTIHVGASGGRGAVRGYVGAGQARPCFLVDLHRVARLIFDGLGPDIQTLHAPAIDDFVERVLLSRERDHPVAVLAPIEPTHAGDPAEYLAPPDEIAAELLGLAHLWVLDRHQTTFSLSDALRDKRLSCFWGALRVYMPGLSRADSGLDHPLLVQDRVADPVERAGLVGEVALRSKDRIPVPFPVETLRAEVGTPLSPGEEARPKVMAGSPDPGETEATGSPPPTSERDAGDIPTSEGLLTAIHHLTEVMVDRLDALAGLHNKLIDEVSRLRTATVVRSANAASIERRLGQFERAIRELATGDQPPGADPEGPVEEEEKVLEAEEEDEFTLVSVLQAAASEFPEDLLVLDSAIASAEDSPFEDVLRVSTNLKAMAELARRRQEGRLGMSLRDAFGEAGVEYRGGISRSTSKRLRQQYQATLPNGRMVDCHEHIVLGNSYDPRFCLRIYFTSRAPGESRFVIAHVGRHLEVKTTT
jgi:hypothetical protein